MLPGLRQALLHYLETNQRDNRNIITGWRQRLQDIYIAHSRKQNSSTTGIPAHHWQHYAEKK